MKNIHRSMKNLFQEGIWTLIHYAEIEKLLFSFNLLKVKRCE